MYVWEQAATAGFGNGRNSIQVRVQGKEDPINVTLKDVFRIPELPCRLLSIGTIRRDGKEFVDSGTKKSYLVPLVQKGRTEDPSSRKKKHFLTLSGSVQGNANDAASAHASFADKKQRLTLKEWHDILFLRQVDPAETWPHPNRRYNCCDGHAVHSVPRMKFSSSLLRKRKTKSDNSRGSDSYRPRGTFSPGRDQNEMRSSFRGRSYPRKAHP